MPIWIQQLVNKKINVIKIKYYSFELKFIKMGDARL